MMKARIMSSLSNDESKDYEFVKETILKSIVIIIYHLLLVAVMLLIGQGHEVFMFNLDFCCCMLSLYCHSLWQV